MKHFKIRARDMLWVVPPLGIYLISELVRGQLGFNGVIFDISQDHALLGAEETQRRIFFIAATLVFIATTLAIAAYTFVDLAKRFKFRELAKFFFVLGVVAVGAVVTLLYPTDVFVNSYEVFGKTRGAPEAPLFFEAALNRSNPALFGKFMILFKATGAALILGIGCVLFGGVSCISEAFGSEAVPSNSKDSPLGRLDSYMFMCAILMVIGLTWYVAQLNWPSYIFAEDEAQLKAYSDIVEGVTIFTGITYSLVIAAFYIPVRKRIIAALPEDLKIEREQKQAALTPEGAKPLHPALAWLPRLTATTQSQREFYSYAFKIAAPVLTAWASTFLNLGGVMGG